MASCGTQTFPQNPPLPQLEDMGDAGGHLPAMMGHEEHADVRITNCPVHSLKDQMAVVAVETLARLVQDEQARIFCQGAREEYQPLLAC